MAVTPFQNLCLSGGQWKLDGAAFDGGEFESFADIRDAVRQAERKERLKRERLVEERYGQSLRQALLPLESESMLPVLVITDMADRNVHTPYGLWSICSAFQPCN